MSARDRLSLGTLLASSGLAAVAQAPLVSPAGALALLTCAVGGFLLGTGFVKPFVK